VRTLRAFRTSDGVAVAVPNSADAYKTKKATAGRCLWVSELGPQGKLVLHLFDPETGKDVWNKTFPAGSILLDSYSPETAAVAEPDGAVTVIDLAARKETLHLKVDKAHLEKVTRATLLRDRTQIYLAFQAPPNGAVGSDPYGNFREWFHWTPVSGMIYAFDRATGDLHWHANAPNQAILLDHFDESPTLIGSAYFVETLPGGAGVNVTVTRFIDKLTGKVLYNKRVMNNNGIDQIHTVGVDPRTGTVELLSNQLKLKQVWETGRDPAKPKEG
jgi:hypothetical protein